PGDSRKGSGRPRAGPPARCPPGRPARPTGDPAAPPPSGSAFPDDAPGASAAPGRRRGRPVPPILLYQVRARPSSFAVAPYSFYLPNSADSETQPPAKPVAQSALDKNFGIGRAHTNPTRQRGERPSIRPPSEALPSLVRRVSMTSPQ